MLARTFECSWVQAPPGSSGGTIPMMMMRGTAPYVVNRFPNHPRLREHLVHVRCGPAKRMAFYVCAPVDLVWKEYVLPPCTHSPSLPSKHRRMDDFLSMVRTRTRIFGFLYPHSHHHHHRLIFIFHARSAASVYR
jgi:hypothetical protein